jgi:NAD(P)-dependent dehydrogenase (short-subunit alcohol dehydrogenase family)
MTARSIRGSVALVTGANRGIGRALVEALVSRGAKKVYAAARDPTSLPVHEGKPVVAIELDVTDPDQLRHVAERAADVQLLFSNAGVLAPAGLEDPRLLVSARREMEVNYFGPLQLFQTLTPVLARNGGGAVVTIGSAAGLSGVAFSPGYSASKAALHSLTQSARVLLAGQGTAVLGVYPGPVDTDMSRELPFAKTPALDVAFAILDGLEAGQEDIFPDPFAVDFGRRFLSSPKEAEREMAALVRAMGAPTAA